MSYHTHEMRRPSAPAGKMKFTVTSSPPRRTKNLTVPRRRLKSRILRIAFSAAIAFLCLPLRTSAQSCALCYTTVSAAGSAAIRALHFGILAVLIPALVLFLAILFMLFRRAAAEPA